MSKEKRQIPEAKSLRWLANMFPWTDNPQDETDKMTNAVHTYAMAGADKIEALGKELEELKEKDIDISNLMPTSCSVCPFVYLTHDCGRGNLTRYSSRPEKCKFNSWYTGFKLREKTMLESGKYERINGV